MASEIIHASVLCDPVRFGVFNSHKKTFTRRDGGD